MSTRPLSLVIALTLFGTALLAAPGAARAEGPYGQTARLIDEDPVDNEDRIRRSATGLSDSQRTNLYMASEVSAGGPFALNLLLGAGIGSFVQGDTTGGLIGLGGELTGLALILAGEDSAPVTIGAILFVGTRIFELVRPWTYASSHNAALRRALLASEDGPSFQLSPTVVADSRGKYEPAMGMSLSW